MKQISWFSAKKHSKKFKNAFLFEKNGKNTKKSKNYSAFFGKFKKIEKTD
jgi:hypothetical protein